MNFTKQTLNDVWVITPQVYKDERGYFMETFRQDEFENHIGKIHFVMENQSESTHGVLRGLHYQKETFSQAKLVRVIEGKVLDVIVDLRKSSTTFGKHLALELSDSNNKQLFVPRGFAHGFFVLSPKVIFVYKVDNYYNPASQVTLAWNDTQLNIDWLRTPNMPLIISDKDRIGKSFQDCDLFE